MKPVHESRKTLAGRKMPAGTKIVLGLPDLTARKWEGAENQALTPGRTGFFARELSAWRERLKSSSETYSLPAQPSSRTGLNDLLVRLRLQTPVPPRPGTQPMVV